MVEVRRYTLEILVGLTACLLTIGTSVPAKASSGNRSGDAAVTEDQTAPSQFPVQSATSGLGSMTSTASGGPDLPPPSTADADSSKSKDSAPQPQTPGPSVSEPVHVAWGPLLGEALLFATSENVVRACCQVDTAPEFKGVLLSDYFKSIANIHGWDDWDPIRVQYVGHSWEGRFQSALRSRMIPWGNIERSAPQATGKVC